MAADDSGKCNDFRRVGEWDEKAGSARAEAASGAGSGAAEAASEGAGDDEAPAGGLMGLFKQIMAMFR